MTSEKMDKRYDPKKVEKHWYKAWQDANLFTADNKSKKEPFTILIPLPNITGSLHIGHALNNTLQDLITRKWRMDGREALWIPGIDHAGISTQIKVEQFLAKKGIFKEKIGRERFEKECWKWKEKYGGIILEQLKRLGASCDWSRLAFTLDPPRSRAVTSAFLHYYNEGLIYRGFYIVNWCPRCGTAISDLEVEHEEQASKLWYLRYPLLDNAGKPTDEYIVVATTRPETMLGDTAVAVNPDDKRHKDKVGRKALLPLVERIIPIVADSQVSVEFGTGAVKVTPAHDPNDYELAQRHQLEAVIVIDPQGNMNKRVPAKYIGASREQCRQMVLEDLDRLDLIEKQEDYRHSVGTCYRCQTIVEPYLSEQWFMKMKPLVGMVMDALKAGKVRYIPERWERISLQWLENIRDWCISRQLWWGHRMPIWYCDDCGQVIASAEAPKNCIKCKSSKLRQEEDVLDTWFSSALWPLSTLGWPEETEDFKKFYPTNVLVTGVDIIFLWVARMILSGLEFKGVVPYSQVYFNTTIQNEEGRRMSKSLGTGVDPMDFIESIGADAVRFTMASVATQSQSIRFSGARFEIGRNFTNKVWNAARFLIPNLDENVQKEKPKKLASEDAWILHRLNKLVKESNENFEQFRFSELVYSLYEFFWHEYCDWYLEMVKERIYQPTSAEDAHSAKYCASYVLDTWLRLIHPIMPFITEEIWQNLPHTSGFIATAPWPHAEKLADMRKQVEEMELVIEVIRAIRTIRADMNIPPGAQIEVLLVPEGKAQDYLKRNLKHLKKLARAKEVLIEPGASAPPHSVTSVLSSVTVYVPMEELIDIDAERQRMEKSIKKLAQEVARIENMLANENFLTKAPQMVVDENLSRLKEMQERIKRLQENLKRLS